jgi:hypothetical protein
MIGPSHGLSGRRQARGSPAAEHPHALAWRHNSGVASQLRPFTVLGSLYVPVSHGPDLILDGDGGFMFISASDSLGPEGCLACAVALSRREPACGA